MNNLFLTDKDGNELEYTVLFTFDSKLNDKSYVVYTDFSKSSDNHTNVWYAQYQNNDFSKLNPVNSKEEIELINDVLSSFESNLIL